MSTITTLLRAEASKRRRYDPELANLLDYAAETIETQAERIAIMEEGSGVNYPERALSFPPEGGEP